MLQECEIRSFFDLLGLGDEAKRKKYHFEFPPIYEGQPIAEEALLSDRVTIEVPEEMEEEDARLE